MSDINALEELLTAWNVPFKYKEFPDKAHEYSVKVGGWSGQNDPRGTVDGYQGFYTLFNFDENGKFISMGAWE